jgi:hypothetical protein
MKAKVATRLAALAIAAVGGSLVPLLLVDRPVLRLTWDRLGPRVVNRVTERVTDRIAPNDSTPTVERPASPKDLHEAPRPRTSQRPARPLVNPSDYCRRHWWTAGPVRRIISWPFRRR